MKTIFGCLLYHQSHPAGVQNLKQSNMLWKQKTSKFLDFEVFILIDFYYAEEEGVILIH